MKNKKNTDKSMTGRAETRSPGKKKTWVTSEMGQFATELNREARKRRYSLKEIFFGFLGLAITIAISVLAIIYQEELSEKGLVEQYGLLGLFLLAFIFKIGIDLEQSNEDIDNI